MTLLTRIYCRSALAREGVGTGDKYVSDVLASSRARWSATPVAPTRIIGTS